MPTIEKRPVPSRLPAFSIWFRKIKRKKNPGENEAPGQNYGNGVF